MRLREYSLLALTLTIALADQRISLANPSIDHSSESEEIQISYATKDGYTYQLQKSSDLTTWVDVGEVQTGDSSQPIKLPLTAPGFPATFYRFARNADYGTPEGWLGHPIASNRIAPDSLDDEASGYHTIVAAKAFAYFTGTLEQAYHEPVGEIANYFGYAALRQEIRDRGGSQADEGFRGASWMETLEILDANQRQILYNLMRVHEPLFEEFFDIRLDLVDELWALREGEELDFANALSIGLQLGRDEAELTVTSAEAYSEILPTLSTEQLQAFQDIRSGATTIADMQQDGPNTAAVESEIAIFNSGQRDVLLAIASKMISWLTGSVDDAVLLPPGKISNYFGFAYYRYIDRANVSRSDAANKFLSVLDDTQQSIMAGLAQDIIATSNAYIDGRENLITGSYPLRIGQSVDHASLVNAYANQAALGETRRAIIEALTFYELEEMMTSEQLAELAKYRADTSE